ncbi:MAG: chlorophyllide reductase subunit Y, partial [Pseudomonadota bacterium]
GSLGQVVSSAIEGKARMDAMRAFFEGVGQGRNAGIWRDIPKDNPGFRKKFARQLERLQARQGREEEIGT